MEKGPLGGTVPQEHAEMFALVLAAIRSGGVRTRPDLVRHLGLGRNAVSQRVAELTELGILEDGSLAPSTGGRPSRELRFRSGAGSYLVAELGATHLQAGLTDLDGTVLAERTEAFDVAVGPQDSLDRLEALFDELLKRGTRPGAPVWGIGVGLPGPVEFSRGRPVSPPIMPGWDGYPVRDRLAARYAAPAWVDNDVNVLALGELKAGIGVGEQDLLYVKVGTGIGAGLISAGRLHRGAQGAAGDIGHVSVLDDDNLLCRCGNTGCLEAVAGGFALARDGLAAAQSGRSHPLAELLGNTGTVTANDVFLAAARGDATSLDLLTQAGSLIGRTLATLVNFYNPSLIVMGGQISVSHPAFLGALRTSVYRRSMALATRDLRITISPLGDGAALQGAASLVADELFSPECLGRWIRGGSPVGRPDLTTPQLVA